MGEGWQPQRTRHKATGKMQRAKDGKHERDRAIAVQAANNSGLQSAAAQLQWSDIRTVTGAGTATVQTL